MKKIFLAICFIAFWGISTPLHADVVPLQGLPNHTGEKTRTAITPDRRVPGMPDPNNQEEVRKFFKKRFETAARSEMGNMEDWEKVSATNVIPSQESLERKAQENKSTFQKIYDEALAALHKKDTPDATSEGQLSEEQAVAQSATRFFTLAPNEVADTPDIKIPTVSAALPSGRKILAPAREHIPYFLSYIDIQSNGYVKIEDTITIVANGKKFAYGLERVFPKYTYSPNSRRHRVEFILDSVTINDVKIPYFIEEIGDNIVLRPKYNQKLEPGVYTYKFNYLINNRLQHNEQFAYLDWSLTGRPMNAFITSANAIITLPDGYSFSNYQVSVGRSGNYTNRRTNVFNLAKNVLAFSNVTPLLNGEQMNIIAVMDNNVLIKDYDKNFNKFLIDWGSVVYAGAGLLTIIIALLLSLISLKNERKNNKYNPSYNGSLMRSILIGKYDRIAFISQLLELYRKNAVDLTVDNNRYFIEKKNVNSPRLSKKEKKALHYLFAKKANILEINNSNNLKLKKARNLFEKSVKKQIKKFRLMHNISYVVFSVAVLLITECFIAFISTNMAQSLTILFSSSLLYIFYIWILRHKFKYILVSIPLKLFALLALSLIWLFSSIYISGITSALLLITILVIFEFSRIFNEQNNFINEAKTAIGNFKEYLISSAEAINLSRDFINQQSNVFALNITEYYPQNVSNKNNYKLDIAEGIKQTLIGIL